MTETEMLSAFFGEGPTEKEELIASTPLRRIGTTEDIADVVAFLVNDEARWITGQVTAASGGR